MSDIIEPQTTQEAKDNALKDIEEFRQEVLKGNLHQYLLAMETENPAGNVHLRFLRCGDTGHTAAFLAISLEHIFAMAHAAGITITAGTLEAAKLRGEEKKPTH